MSIVSHSHPFVVGVDTHARKHVYTILTATTGVVIDTRDFPTTTAGINRAIAWVARHTEADADTLWVIEGAASYGAILTGTVASHGYPVAEAPRMDAKQHHGVGKSDTLDARKTLTNTQIVEVATWRTRKEELSLSIAHAEAIRLAKHIIDLDKQVLDNEKRLTELVQASRAAPLLQEKGFGPISAAKCLTAWSHHGRVHTETEFASLAGVNPIPASSGNIVRHRLNRGGDRALNSALHMVAISKMTHDEETRVYVERRRAEHKTDREIRRCLKRYLARRVFRILNVQNDALQTS